MRSFHAMRAIRRWVFRLHRLLGTLLCLLFLMWCISGYVVIYHGFPRLEHREELARSLPLDPTQLPSPDSLCDILRTHGVSPDTIASLSVTRGLTGAVTIQVKSKKRTQQLFSDGTPVPPRVVDSAYLTVLASRWPECSGWRVDTLYSIDQWTPSNALKAELPFYRLVSREGQHIYVGSQSGEILTESTRGDRIWAMVGAIPHWLYPTLLRQNRSVWRATVVVLGLLGSFMVGFGLYIGLEAYAKGWKRKRWHTPYKRRAYAWHHQLGTLGGLFLFLWIFSVLMSVVQLPGWLAGVPRGWKTPSLNVRTMPLSAYALDYRTLLAAQPEARAIAWSNFNGLPILTVHTPEASVAYDARTSTPRPLALTQEEVTAAIAQVNSGAEVRCELITRYDLYYRPRRHGSPLPAYRVQLNDAYSTTYYVDPQSGTYRSTNRATRLKSWLFTIPHRLALPALTNRPWLWRGLVWLLLAIGTVVSGTGVILGIRYLRRWLKRRRSRGRTRAGRGGSSCDAKA